jgi:hypothetical protein
MDLTILLILSLTMALVIYYFYNREAYRKWEREEPTMQLINNRPWKGEYSAPPFETTTKMMMKEGSEEAAVGKGYSEREAPWGVGSPPLNGSDVLVPMQKSNPPHQLFYNAATEPAWDNLKYKKYKTFALKKQRPDVSVLRDDMDEQVNYPLPGTRPGVEPYTSERPCGPW